MEDNNKFRGCLLFKTFDITPFHMKLVPLFALIAVLFAACAPTKPLSFSDEIAQYRTEKIKATIAGDRHPLDPGDEQWLRFYPAQEKYRVTARFTPATNPKTFEMPTYSGAIREYQPYGTLTFPLDGQEYVLTLYRNMALTQAIYRDYLFMPFKDATNGQDTYKGGRYLDVKTTDIKNGTMTLDFNKVYNPWCAYSDGYNCPIPPADNHLKIAIPAGEKTYAGERKLE